MKNQSRVARFGALVTTGAVIATMSVVGFALPASAHTPEVFADCDTLTVTATNYEVQPGTPAVTEEREVTPAVPGTPEIPAVPETPAVPAVYEIEYEFVHKKENHPNSPRWEAEGWNADDNENSKGWYSTGNTRQGALITPEVPAVPGTPAVPAVPGTPAVVETVVVTPAVPGNNAPNTVSIFVDDMTNPVDTAIFGTSFSQTIDLPGTGHEYKVTFTAWNDPDGSKGWTKTFTGTTEPCEDPTPPAISVEFGPQIPTFIDECGVENDTWIIPTPRNEDDVWQYAYQTSPDVGDNGYFYAYLPVGYQIGNTGNRFWYPVWEAHDYFTNEPCPVITPEPETPEQPEQPPVDNTPPAATDEDPQPASQITSQGLAVTGGETDYLMYVLAGGMGVILIGLVAMNVARRRSQREVVESDES